MNVNRRLHLLINDLAEGISSNIRLFADDVALFAKVTDPDLTYETLTNDLAKIYARILIAHEIASKLKIETDMNCNQVFLHISILR